MILSDGKSNSPLRSLRMVGNDAVEYQIVLLVLLKIIPVTVNIYIRKSFKILDSVLTSSPASHRGCGSSSPIYPWSCSPPFLPPEILICTLASANKKHHSRGTKTYHMHPLTLVGGSWYLRKWEVGKIFQSPVLLRHGQSREFYQCTQPEIDLNQI